MVTHASLPCHADPHPEGTLVANWPPSNLRRSIWRPEWREEKQTPPPRAIEAISFFWYRWDVFVTISKVLYGYEWNGRLGVRGGTNCKNCTYWRFENLKISKFQNSKISKFQNFKIRKFENLKFKIQKFGNWIWCLLVNGAMCLEVCLSVSLPFCPSANLPLCPKRPSFHFSYIPICHIFILPTQVLFCCLLRCVPHARFISAQKRSWIPWHACRLGRILISTPTHHKPGWNNPSSVSKSRCGTNAAKIMRQKGTGQKCIPHFYLQIGPFQIGTRQVGITQIRILPSNKIEWQTTPK